MYNCAVSLGDDRSRLSNCIVKSLWDRFPRKLPLSDLQNSMNNAPYSSLTESQRKYLY